MIMSLAGYLLLFFMGMFWVFRLIVAFTYTFGIEFAVLPLNLNMEVVLLFVAFICLLLVIKRKMLGAIIYAIAYYIYFGYDLYLKLMVVAGGNSNINDYTSLIISFIGVIIPTAILLELAFDKNRKAHPVDKKTDWFYKNEQYDRKLDERADKNNYRTM